MPGPRLLTECYHFLACIPPAPLAALSVLWIRQGCSHHRAFAVAVPPVGNDLISDLLMLIQISTHRTPLREPFPNHI